MTAEDPKASPLDDHRFLSARKNTGDADLGDDRAIARLSCLRRRAVMASIETNFIV